MSQRSLPKVLAAFVGIAVFGSTAANAATTAPPTVDPLFAAAVLGTSGSREAGALAPAGYSLAAAPGGSDVGYGGDNGMWALWVGLGAVAVRHAFLGVQHEQPVPRHRLVEDPQRPVGGGEVAAGHHAGVVRQAGQHGRQLRFGDHPHVLTPGDLGEMPPDHK